MAEGLPESMMPTDPLMGPAWASCLSWAIGEPEIMADFRRNTGCDWKPGRTPIERMIDEATGSERDFIVRFVGWFNEFVWGDLNLQV